jgi:hypothetical protein
VHLQIKTATGRHPSIDRYAFFSNEQINTPVELDYNKEYTLVGSYMDNRWQKHVVEIVFSYPPKIDRYVDMIVSNKKSTKK